MERPGTSVNINVPSHQYCNGSNEKTRYLGQHQRTVSLLQRWYRNGESRRPMQYQGTVSLVQEWPQGDKETLEIPTLAWLYLTNYIVESADSKRPIRTRAVGFHDDVIKWKHFPRYWPFVRGIHRSPVNSPHKGQWRGALMFSLICVWINNWVNNRETGDLRRCRAHYGVTVMN